MEIYIFGAGGQALWAKEICILLGHEFVIVDKEDEVRVLSGNIAHYHVAIGDNHIREGVYSRIRKAKSGAKAVTLVHPQAYIAASASIADGCLVLAGAVVGPETRVSIGCSLWTNSVLEHHSVMGKFSSLAPGAITGGNVSIGQHAFLGLNSCIRHGAKIGGNTVIGCGATVVKDIADNQTAYGTPAKAIKTRNIGEGYL